MKRGPPSMKPAVCTARGNRGPGGMRRSGVVEVSAISQGMVAQPQPATYVWLSGTGRVSPAGRRSKRRGSQEQLVARQFLSVRQTDDRRGGDSRGRRLAAV